MKQFHIETKEELEELISITKSHVFVFSDLHIRSKYGGIDYLPIAKSILTNDKVNEHPTIFLGDLFDSAKPSPEENAAFLYGVKDRQTDLYLLEGNHTVTSSDVISATRAFETVLSGNIHIVDSARSEVVLGYNFIFIPYGKNMEETIKEDVQRLKKDDQTNIVILHAAVANQISNTGSVLDGIGIVIPLGTFEGIDLVLGGDFHRRQEIQNADGVPAFYVGAPSQLGFGDNFEGSFGYIARSKETNELCYLSLNSSLIVDSLSFITFTDIEENLKRAFHYKLDISLLPPVNSNTAIRLIYNKSNMAAQEFAAKVKSSGYGKVYDQSYSEIATERIASADYESASQADHWRAGFKKFVLNQTSSEEASAYSALVGE